MRKALFTFVSALLILCGVRGNAASYTSTVSPTTGNGIIQFSEMNLSPITCFDDDGKTKVRSNLTTLGDPIVLRGVRYESGVGTHAPSVAIIDLKGATRFYTILGVDDDAKSQADHGIVNYTVTLYKDKAATTVSSGTIYRTDAAGKTLDIDVAGYDYLKLDLATGAQAWADQCVYADARFYYTGTAPQVISQTDMYPDTSDPSVVRLPEAGPNGEEIIPLSSLQIDRTTIGWGTVQANKSVDGNPLIMKGITYTSGIGTHATAKVNVKLNGAVTEFHAKIGIDDEVRSQCLGYSGNGVCEYCVTLVKQNGDVDVFASGTIRFTDTAPVSIDITDDLQSYKFLIIELPEGTGSNSCDHVDIANAYFCYQEQNSTRPEIVSEDALEGKLNCATIVFSQPGVRFMHKLKSNAAGAEITVKNLPAGLTFNEERCLVEGIIETEGKYTYTAVVTVDGESSEDVINLTVSSSLQQPTPFMGWLSWNVVQSDISESVIKTVADAFVSQGLLDAGYNHLVIDDQWHASSRASDGSPRPHATKFPNGRKVCADYVHSKGLKFGIYSDAATRTCAGEFGSYGYETIDANTYAQWGVDMLKYDYCGAPADQQACRERYKTMNDALIATGRPIILYMCEWGVRDPWKWAPEIGISCWRSTYDTRDGWNGVSGGIGMTESVELMKDLWPYTGVNRWNDADMMCVGIHGTGKSSNDLVVKAGMTQDEYRTQFALWCMWSSPLTLSFDLRKNISDDDLAIMTNAEMIALNQDRMGQAAEFLGADANQCHLFVKDLENGDVAVAVTNMSSAACPYIIDFAKIPALDASQTYAVRDVQARADLPDATVGSYAITTVKSHETKVYRFSKKSPTSVSLPSETIENMTVEAEGGILTVCLNGTGNASKRILVSDSEGHIIGAATTTDECVSFNTEGRNGLYIVNAVCNGRSHSVKTIL